MKEKKAEVVITRWENDSVTVTYKGISSRADVHFLIHSLEKDVRKRKSARISFSENFPLAFASATNGSPTETGAQKEVLDATG